MMAVAVDRIPAAAAAAAAVVEGTPVRHPRLGAARLYTQTPERLLSTPSISLL